MKPTAYKIPLEQLNTSSVSTVVISVLAQHHNNTQLANLLGCSRTTIVKHLAKGLELKSTRNYVALPANMLGQGLSILELAILAILLRSESFQNTTTISHQCMANKLGVSKSTAKRAQRKLRSRGVLKATRRWVSKAGSRSWNLANKYTVAVGRIFQKQIESVLSVAKHFNKKKWTPKRFGFKTLDKLIHKAALDWLWENDTNKKGTPATYERTFLRMYKEVVLFNVLPF